MGVVSNITADTFPRQSSHVGNPASVCFHYDLSREFRGTIVRDDLEEPFVTIIQLEDGRYVLTTECQYRTL